MYFRPAGRKLEWEEREKTYDQRDIIWSEITTIIQKEVDLVVLNSARSMLTFHILRQGIPIAINDYSLYLRLLIRSGHEAIDFYDFIFEFYKIKQRSM